MKIIHTFISVWVLTVNLFAQQGKIDTTITDFEGNIYKTVTIGDQHWMAENLNVSKYNDGTLIPNIKENLKWQNNTTGAWAFYKNDAAKYAKYGKIYNWYALSPFTNGNKNVCPSGWHVPTDDEWQILSNFLGDEGDNGGKIKEVGTKNWNAPNTSATNSTLFTALPGGYRTYIGEFEGLHEIGCWWSSTESDSEQAYYRTLYFDEAYINNRNKSKVDGFSVRCIKD